jgi:steroid delta-isomerase-like uncharacterized protein
MKTPREVVAAWADAFNRRDADAAADLYEDNATNWQVAAGEPAVGRDSILADFREFFAAFPDSYTDTENLFEDDEWAILEWSGGGTWRGAFVGREPNGRSFKLRGCGFFRVVDGKIRFQRGYWDKLTWFKQLAIPVE